MPAPCSTGMEPRRGAGMGPAITVSFGRFGQNGVVQACLYIRWP